MKCPKCNDKDWKETCQQTQCIVEFGECLACLALSDRSDEDWSKVMKFLRDNPIKKEI